MNDPISGWKPELHPRDNKGRFKNKAQLISESQRAAGRDVIDRFKPKPIRSNADAEAYFRSRKPDLSEDERNAVDSYTGDGFYDMNQRLRDGDDSDPEIGRLDAAMRPLPDDLVVKRTLGFEAFGFDGKSKAGIEDLQGRVVEDPAFSSTALGSPYGGGLGGVTMHIAVPAGTPAALVSSISRNPHEREVLLGRGLKLAVSRVAANDRYGYDVFAVVLPA